LADAGHSTLLVPLEDFAADGNVRPARVEHGLEGFVAEEMVGVDANPVVDCLGGAGVAELVSGNVAGSAWFGSG